MFLLFFSLMLLLFLLLLLFAFLTDSQTHPWARFNRAEIGTIATGANPGGLCALSPGGAETGLVAYPGCQTGEAVVVDTVTMEVVSVVRVEDEQGTVRCVVCAVAEGRVASLPSHRFG